MISFDDYTNENKTEHNLKLPYILDHPYTICMEILGLITMEIFIRKNNALLNLIKNQPDPDKIYIICKRSLWSKILMFN